MAISVVRDANELYRSSGITSNTYTAMFWLILTSRPDGQDQAFWGRGNGTQGTVVAATASDGGTADAFWFGDEDGYAYGASSTIVTDTWYHIAVTRNGSSHEVFLDGVSHISHARNTTTRDRIYLAHGSDYYNAGSNSRIAAFKAFGAVLTAVEIQQELYFFTPIRTNNLELWSPFVADETANFRDYSGAGSDWTENGTITAGPGPPITWRKGASKIFVPLGVAVDLSHVAALADSFDNVVRRRPIKVTNF